MAAVSARSWATAAKDAGLGSSVAETPVSPQALHRHDLVVLFLLLAIAGIVLALAMTVGTQPVI